MRRIPMVTTSITTNSRRWLGATSILIVILVLMGLGIVGWIGSERAIHPLPNEDLPRIQDYPHLPLDEIVFLSRDGARLIGWFLPRMDNTNPSRAGTVILLHGYRDRKDQMLPHADYLHRAGHNVLLFDFRASGGSEGDAVTFGAREQGDVSGAIDYLAARGDVDVELVGLQGLSLGAAVAIMAAANDDRISGVIAEAPFKDLPSEIAHSFESRIGLPQFPFAPITVWITEQRLGIRASAISPLQAVTKLEGRSLLIIDDELDESIAPGSARSVFDAALDPKLYWIAPQAAHAEGHRDATIEYEHQVLTFWARLFTR